MVFTEDIVKKLYIQSHASFSYKICVIILSNTLRLMFTFNCIRYNFFYRHVCIHFIMVNCVALVDKYLLETIHTKANGKI